MDEFYILLISAGILVIIVPFFIEITYFITACFIFTNCCKKRFPVTEQFTSYGIYIPNVVELMKGNYAWHLRTFEYNRLKFVQRTGIADAIRLKKARISLSSLALYYGNPLQLFSRYKVTSKISYWKDRDFYLETRIEALHDGSKGAMCIAKLTFERHCFEDILRCIAQSKESIPTTNEVPLELKKWMEFNQSSSDLLKLQRVEGLA